MFEFMNRSAMRNRSNAILRSVEADGLPPGTDVPMLGVAQSRGTYAGRKVTYWRVFDPKRAAGSEANAAADHSYRGLEAHLDLVLRTGFTERDGRVVVDSRPPEMDWAVRGREPADRAAHADVEQFMQHTGTAGSRP